MEKVIGYTLLASAALLGSVALLAIGLFFWHGAFDLIDLPGSNLAGLGWDILLSAAFFLQHSIMARASFRRRLGAVIPPHYHGVAFTLASSVALLAVVMLWQESALLVSLDGVLRLAFRGAFLLAAAWMAWGAFSLRSLDSLGLSRLQAHLSGTPHRETPLALRGPYRWVRHPLYLGTLVFIWSCPDLTEDRLFFNVTWSLWILAGAVLEERDLAAVFGERYRAYQRAVPMLLPYRLPARTGKTPTSEQPLDETGGRCA